MSKKNFAVFVYRHNQNCFEFDIYDLSTGFCNHESHDLMKFLENPPSFYKTGVKLMIFNTDSFKKNGIMDYKFYERVIAKLTQHQIPFQFIYSYYINAMCQLMAAKVDPIIDKIIYQFPVDQSSISVRKLIRQNVGYVIAQEYYLKYNEIHYDFSQPFKAIISCSNWIPTSEQSAQMEKLQQALSSFSRVLLKEPPKKFCFDAFKVIINQMIDGAINQNYFILPPCLNVFRINNNYKTLLVPFHEMPLICTSYNELLPFTKSCIVSRFHKTFYLASTFNPIYQSLHVTKDCHRIKLILSVDVNEFPTFIHEPIILPRIQKMPKKLNIERTEKLPIIGFFDNSSVICLWNENENCYKFLESWNQGCKFGKDLFMDFLRSKPTLISSSTEVISLSGAVYDLIKIMSMPSNDIKIDRNWKFTLTKDAENPILLEFDTAEEGRKAASPAFLMALMLKQHLKVLRKVIGGKPAKIGFRLLNDFENLETKKRVEVGLKEACEMLKISCIFV